MKKKTETEQIGLKELRQQIDQLDQMWLLILARRFQVTRLVGQIKKNSTLPSIDPNREKKQMAQITAIAKKANVDPELVQKILRLIIDSVVKEHNSIRK